ncbi:hypothetical protein C5167_035209 [Papaver somniferum]|uniref:Uncharacterized protein n=1 Tax=Papaver somniferum TaxID=3469 RepID=A0A4Y7KGP2_PAPSO|nr:hypothetical protein C5167_035209 [Papaver somniferum]
MAISKNDEEGGSEALKELKSVDPPLFLSPSPILSQATRLASQYLYSSLHPFCPKSPFQKLLVKGFDAEQIWQQIDTQSIHLLGEFGVDNGEDDDEMGNARYEDFFGAKKGESTKRKSDSQEGVEDSDSEDEDDFDKGFEDEQKEGSLSTYEKEQKKQRAKIEEMEKANMETKSWNMLGEVSAAERGKNTALEVDLDFEHNVRPAPVITEEVTQSLEDLIKKRVLEGHFDDVQKAPSLPSAAPKEYKEIDENKNTEGLHKSYENEYLQQTGLVPESFSDERKKEASLLFQKLCYKLDALSHFHFTPKPIIEDMSIQVNVPALAMEEIAPLVVSDATMLAPEEVFAGKGDIKEEAELTQAERKRRRASKKRKFAGKTKV